MSAALAHLALASAGVWACALAARRAALRFDDRPARAYRWTVALALVALVLPAAQLAVEGRVRIARTPTIDEAGVRSERTPVVEDGADAAKAELASSTLDALPPAAFVGLLPLVGSWLEEASPEPAPLAQEAPSWAARSSWLAAFARLGVLLPAALLAAYALGVVVRLGLTLARWLRTRALLARARPAPEAWRRRWLEAAGGSRTGRRTRVLVSDELRGPACFGVWRTAVVLPADDPFEGHAELARCVLLHELVHLERRDTLSIALRELLAAAFWFHPAAHALARALDELRELSCDALVVARTGDPRGYASALVEYAASRIGARTPATDRSGALLAPSWPDAPSSLHRRIDMLISHGNGSLGSRRGSASLAALLVLFAAAQVATAATLFPRQQEAPASPGSRASAVTAPEVRQEALSALPAPSPLPAPRAPGAAGLFGDAHASNAGAAAEERMMLGIHYEPAGEALAAQLGRNAGEVVVVTRVVGGSPADSVGLKRFDALVAVDGRAPTRAALEDAGRKLSRSEPVRLELVRGGVPHTFVVGPFDEGFRVRWNEAARGLGTSAPRFPRLDEARDNALLPSPQGDAPRDPDVARARSWFDLARGYYDSVDAERFRGDLRKALAELQKRDAGELGRDERAYRELVAKLADQSDEATREYLGNVRGWLNRSDAQTFWRDHGQRMSRLDEETLHGLLKRWQSGAGQGSPWTNLYAPNVARQRQVREDAEEATRAELERTRAALREQERRLDELMRKLEALERAQGAR